MDTNEQIPQARESGPGHAGAVTRVAVLSLVFGLIGGLAGGWFAGTRAVEIGQRQGPINRSVTQVSEDTAVVDLVKRVSPAVVSIVVSKDLNKIPGFSVDPFGDDFFAPFFGQPRRAQTPAEPAQPNIQQVGAGSGFFVSADGLIVTNRHVVADEQASYTVVTQDGKRYDARVLARDPVNDLAIAKVDVSGAPFLELSASGAPEIGQRVIAIGYSLGQYQNTVTTGIVSGIGRRIVASGSSGEEQLEGVIQTDAAINPGNSGGPLLGVSGKVVGINTAIDREGQLVGFAIPAGDAVRALESFKKTGRIARPYLGVRYVIVTPTIAQQQKLARDHGALVVRGDQPSEPGVVPGSPADRAGIAEGDIILQVDGKDVTSDQTLAGLLKGYSVGETVKLRVYRQSEERDVSLALGEAP